MYIPPDDSPYFRPVHYGALAQRTRETGNVIVMGDLNARVGVPRLEDENGTYYDYREVKDDGGNGHGRTLTNICHNNAMVIANHLHKNGRQLGGDLSFKRRNTWISEIDLCLTKRDCIDLIKSVEVRQEVRGSDHAPLCVTLMIESRRAVSPSHLLQRAVSLGQSHHEVIATECGVQDC